MHASPLPGYVLIDYRLKEALFLYGLVSPLAKLNVNLTS